MLTEEETKKYKELAELLFFCNNYLFHIVAKFNNNQIISALYSIIDADKDFNKNLANNEFFKAKYSKAFNLLYTWFNGRIRQGYDDIPSALDRFKHDKDIYTFAISAKEMHCLLNDVFTEVNIKGGEFFKENKKDPFLCIKNKYTTQFDEERKD